MDVGDPQLALAQSSMFSQLVSPFYEKLAERLRSQIESQLMPYTKYLELAQPMGDFFSSFLWDLQDSQNQFRMRVMDASKFATTHIHER